MWLDFTGKNVLITGGSRGIGRACATVFSNLNANVIITYKSNREEADKTIVALNSARKNTKYQMDISNAENVQEVFSLIIKEYGNIDVLVNNAGVYIKHIITDVSYTQWQQSWYDTMATNLIGISNLCYLAGNHMIQQNAGKIINISSRGAFRGEPDHPAYAASKAGLNTLSQSLAVALGKFNIVVGVVAPGFVETEMAPGFVETEMATAYLKGEGGEEIRRQSPMNRVATPTEVANAVVMFASSGVEFMTGGIIDVNGASYLRS